MSKLAGQLDQAVPGLLRLELNAPELKLSGSLMFALSRDRGN